MRLLVQNLAKRQREQHLVPRRAARGMAPAVDDTKKGIEATVCVALVMTVTVVLWW